MAMAAATTMDRDASPALRGYRRLVRTENKKATRYSKSGTAKPLKSEATTIWSELE